MRHNFGLKTPMRAVCALGLSAAMVFSSVPVTAFAETSDAIRAQMAEVQARLIELNDEAEQSTYELQATTAQLDKTNADIEQLNVDIKKTGEELVQARADLTVTMSTAYKNRPDILSLLLSSSSFEELISNIYYANKISSNQSEQIGKVRDLSNKQKQQMTDLETRRTEQEQLVEEQSERTAAAQNAVASLAAYQSSLSVELQEALAAEERARQEEARRAAEAEAARRAAEQEAARQAAEQEAARRAAESSTTTNSTPSGDSSTPSNSTPGTPTPSTPTQSTPTQSEPTYEEPTYDEPSYDDDYEEPEIYVPPVVTPTYEVHVPDAGSVSAMVDRAYSVIGANYTWSGYVWTGDIYSSYFTCSGLIDFAMGRSTNSSWPESLYAEVGSHLTYNISNLQYGDLVFYSYAGRYPGHVGIYIGGGNIIDSIPGTGVAIRPVDYMDFIGGGPIY